MNATTTLNSVFKRCIQNSNALRTRAFSASVSARQDAEPQTRGIPLALDFGGISIGANAPFARRLAVNRLASAPRTSDNAGRKPSEAKSLNPQMRTANADRPRRPNTNNNRSNNAQSNTRSQTQRNRPSNHSSSNSPRTTPLPNGGSESLRASSSGERRAPKDRKEIYKTNIEANSEKRLATPRAPQQQPRNSNATKTPERGAARGRTDRVKQTPGEQRGSERAERRGGGRVRSNRRRNKAEATAEAPDAHADVDSRLRPVIPSFPAMDRALLSAPLESKTQPPATAVGSSSLLQSSSYDKFRITNTIRPTLVRYPNIVATARLALSRHRIIRFQDRNHALRVVKKLAEKSRSFTKVQAN
ncbi:hypothetical protein SCHPADRAFT_932665 [Schizopora paradoxa]|uniref:Uncharacterized protein n=1 Tax=Schizopora paradoxa TaxID=27342 RepID=A0A0H2R5H0_9AGAM|nr:hypothetical protein SCHPADRAFT_932665 [Schizopora paradoxa]